MSEKKFALLIDAENISVNYLESIIMEIKKYGVITYQRMYGDFTGNRMSEWNKRALEYAIVPIQQPIYTSGKNAADIMLVIDAMDILYQRNVDGFCIVSSDSDFTRLANRLREDGMTVIGMGSSNASKTFIIACNEYKYLDKIAMEDSHMLDTKEDIKDDESSVTPLKTIKSAINNIVQQAESRGEHANLGSTKSQLQREYPDFDERNYGYTLFKKFIEDATKFEIQKEGHTVSIIRKKNYNCEERVRAYIVNRAEQGIELGILGRNLNENFPEFKYKELVFSRLSKYMESINEIEIIKGEKKTTIIKKGSK